MEIFLSDPWLESLNMLGGETYYLTAEYNGECDCFNAANLEIVTSREQAESALLSEIERRLNELFGAVEY